MLKTRFVVSLFSSCATRQPYLTFVHALLCHTVARRFIRKHNVGGRVRSKLFFERRFVRECQRDFILSVVWPKACKQIVFRLFILFLCMCVCESVHACRGSYFWEFDSCCGHFEVFDSHHSSFIFPLPPLLCCLHWPWDPLSSLESAPAAIDCWADRLWHVKV